MANLFWKSTAGTKRLLATPFKTEEDFEKTVFAASDLLEDIFPLKRQIRRGAKAGIPDIVAVDSDGNVCIVEMKNVPVDADIIPQVLQYAIWAETNPDSIKFLWLECANRPEDLSIPWDSLQVRIIIVAPMIRRSTLALADKINYPIDLIEISRWIDGDNQLLLVNRLEPQYHKVRKTVEGGIRLRRTQQDQGSRPPSPFRGGLWQAHRQIDAIRRDTVSLPAGNAVEWPRGSFVVVCLDRDPLEANERGDCTGLNE